MTRYTPKIPKAREILIDALEHNMDHEVRDAIFAYYEMNPKESTSKIAQVFNVNQGRVSEILAGKYD